MAGAVTVSETVVVSTVLPAVPVTVMRIGAGATDEATVIDMLRLPVPVIEPGEANVTVTPDGSPEADSATGVLNPPVTVLEMLEVPDRLARLKPTGRSAQAEAGRWQRIRQAR